MLDEVARKRVVTRWNRRVTGENSARPDRLQRSLQNVTRLQQFAKPLRDNKCYVTLVQVPYCRSVAERAQRANSADAENHFLTQAGFALADIKVGGQFAAPRWVLLDVRVE